jgi:hypothetical protein
LGRRQQPCGLFFGQPRLFGRHAARDGDLRQGGEKALERRSQQPFQEREALRTAEGQLM